MGRSRLDLVSSLIKYGYDDDMVVTMCYAQARVPSR
jgi:hypothetical protein